MLAHYADWITNRLRHPSTVTSGQAGVYDAAGNLTQWHDKDGGTVTTYDSYPWGQMRNLSRTGFERQYAYIVLPS